MISPFSLIPSGLAFAGGVIVFYQLPELPSFARSETTLVAMLIALLLLLILLHWINLLRLPLLALLGMIWAAMQAGAVLRHPFPDALAREPLTIEGRIAAIPSASPLRTRFLFQVESAFHHEQPIPFTGLVRLAWYQPAPALNAGERWRLAVRLKPRHSSANPNGMDGERVLFAQSIQATGTVRRATARIAVVNARLDASGGKYWLARWRQRIAAHLTQITGATDARGLVQALTIGETSQLQTADWEALTLTGTSHLIAISGWNVAMIAGVFIGFTRWLWSRSARLTQLLATPRAGAVVGMVAAVGYAGLAGFAISTQRALIMLLILLSAQLWQRTLRPYHALTLALVGVLLVDSSTVLSYGFWLSFGAVAVLLFHLGQRLPRRDLWTQWGRAQTAVTIGLLPLLVLLFGQISLISPLVNLLAVPVFAVLLPLVLIVSLLSLIPELTAPLLWTAQLLNFCMDGLTWIATLPDIAPTLSAPPLWAWLVAGIGVALLLAPRGLPGRWLGMVLLLPLITLRPPRPVDGELWFTLLDVGQGLAAVMQTAEGTLVFDTGSGSADGFNAGSAVIAPFLLAQGITRVERVVISHADQDHAGGLVGLAKRVTLAQVQSGEPVRLAFSGATRCSAGETWHWAGVRFEFLHPAQAFELGNQSSCVLRIETAGRAILLTGDADQQIERALVAQFGAALKSTVLVAGHHGSNTSSAGIFLNTVKPEWVFFSAGYANQFRFPTKAVRERIAVRRIKTCNTASAGAIQLRIHANGQIDAPIEWRNQKPRLWRHRISECVDDYVAK
ncbi:DNA internalization-related competence protein ComEC/Rec2 [Chromatium weissei]|nr:DNA internalization-related competence protein ComEC/Rec2 [Chromatium weissei]